MKIAYKATQLIFKFQDSIKGVYKMKTESNQDLLRIRKEIIEKSLCDSDLEKKNILDKYFCSKPSIVSYLQEKYSFSNLKVLEIGSWLGQHLFYWGSQSEGIDVQDKAVSFTNSLGFKTTKINVEEGLGFIPDQSIAFLFKYLS